MVDISVMFFFYFNIFLGGYSFDFNRLNIYVHIFLVNTILNVAKNISINVYNVYYLHHLRIKGVLH